MTALEIALATVVVIENSVLIALLVAKVIGSIGRRRDEAALQSLRIGKCERKVKALSRRLEAVEAYAKAVDADELDEGEASISLSDLFGIFSGNREQKEVDSDEALPENR